VTDARRIVVVEARSSSATRERFAADRGWKPQGVARRCKMRTEGCWFVRNAENLEGNEWRWWICRRQTRSVLTDVAWWFPVKNKYSYLSMPEHVRRHEPWGGR